MIAEDFAELAQIAATRGVAAGEERAARLAYHPQGRRPRASVATALAARIYVRDHFVCRYCGRRTVLLPVLELLARLYPTEIPYVNDHLPAGRTHPAFTRLSASVDHVRPAALGGTNDQANLVTACWPCNVAKSEFDLEFLGWTIHPIDHVDWSGLVEYHRPLWHLAGEPDRARHLRWMRAVDAAAREADQRRERAMTAAPASPATA